MSVLNANTSALAGLNTIFTISLFPEIFNCLNHGVLRRASSEGVALTHLQLSDYAVRKDRRVDDRPFGGSSGMLLQAPIIDAALSDLKSHYPQAQLIVADPTGRPFKQSDAARLSRTPELIFLCGRYEGIDARVWHKHPAEFYSIGDVVVTGGELPACLMIDAILRELDGILGNPESRRQDSFQSSRLDYAQYTRPWDWKSITPPDILRTGHHEKLRRWRHQQSLGITWLHRPDLLIGQTLSHEDIEDLMTYLNEWEPINNEPNHQGN